ncbi:MAG TPA: hypothetical protein VH210_09715 [Gaiellaceae bacterium]|nr:hypothetical protein [Gaiellaceae bacterium]
MREAKVPNVTVYFWAIKILSTALGEATSDYLVHTFNPYVAVIGGFFGFAVALTIQFTVKGYRPSVYWFAVVMVAVFGTMAADVLHIQFGVPYAVSAAAFAVALAAVFGAWYLSEGTLSVKSISTPRRELFYWAAVVTTFAMGTALGDLAAYTAKLGFLTAGVLFAVAFVLPALGYRFLGLDAIVAFWAAYILTRPLGASFADWTGKARTTGALGLGDGPVSAVLVVAIAALVMYLAVTKKDRQSSLAAA